MFIDSNEANRVIEDIKKIPEEYDFDRIHFDEKSALMRAIRTNMQSGADEAGPKRIIPVSMLNRDGDTFMLPSDKFMGTRVPKVAELATMNDVLAEVLQNAVVHGSRFGQNGNIDVIIQRKGTRIITVMRDPGEGFDHINWPKKGDGFRVMNLAPNTQVAFEYDRRTEGFNAIVIGFRHKVEQLMFSTTGSVSH